MKNTIYKSTFNGLDGYEICDDEKCVFILHEDGRELANSLLGMVDEYDNKKNNEIDNEIGLLWARICMLEKAKNNDVCTVNRMDIIKDNQKNQHDYYSLYSSRSKY